MTDDEITKKILRPEALDAEVPTRKIPILKCAVHVEDVLCRCPCHSRPTIYHLRPCCTPCPECGFKVVNPRPPSEDPDPEDQSFSLVSR